MIFSMTGYAAVTDESPLGGLSLDLRSVNHRYLDIQFRMPEELRLLEPELRERISARVSRGKVECRVLGLKLIEHFDRQVALVLQDSSQRRLFRPPPHRACITHIVQHSDPPC